MLKNTIKKGLTNSIGWNLGNKYKSIHLLDPLTSTPIKGTNIKAFIYGKNKKFFNKQLKGKIQYSNFNNLNDALKRIFLIINKKNFPKKNIIFSPSAASFDSFENFEERGDYFNKLIKRYLIN